MKHFVLFILIASSYGGFAQVKGKIISKEDGTPVGFANVSVEKTTVGVMSNNEGEFSLLIPKEHYDKKIIMSCMGFIPDTIFPPYSREELTVSLGKDVFQLEEVTVKPVNPLEILRSAFQKIPDNYFLTPTYLNAYYRETVSADSAFVKYADAACQLYYCGYSTPYNKSIASKKYYKINFSTWNNTSPFPQAALSAPHQNDAVKIIEARKSNNLETFSNRWGFEESLKRFDIGGGPLHVTSADVVKLKTAMLDTTSWKYYQFKFAGTLKGQEVDVLKFYPKGKNKIAKWQGSIYIDKKSGAFVEFDFSISPKHLKYIVAEVEQTVKLKRREKKQVKEAYIRRLTKTTNQRIRLKYSQLGCKWHLSYARLENTYMNKGKAFDDIHYKTFTELYVNEVQVNNVFPFTEEAFTTIQTNYLFQTKFKYTPSFWKNYNFPIPNKLLKAALLDLEKDETLENQFSN
ncbi:MAG: carboxypeptidase-like regulatory domain-containing protein [Draconibacterium sp.]